MRKLQNLLAALVIVAILLALGAYYLANQRIAQLHGPNHIRAAGDQIVVVDGRHLSWLAADTGELIKQRRRDELGLPSLLMDIQLLPDGTLLAAETETQRIRRCTPDKNPCGTLADLSELTGRFFKFAFVPDSERLFVAGTHSNRIWELNPPYTEPQTRVFYRPLLAPNEIRLSPEATLWVAETDRRRIVELADGQPMATETGRVLEGRNELLKKSYPLDFAGSETGPWWVLLTGPTYFNGVVVEYGPDLSPVREVVLPPGSDPIAVEPLGAGALITDMEGFALYRITAEGEAARFGDEAYYRSLDAVKEERDYHRLLEKIALAVLLFGVLGAVIVAVWAHRSGNIKKPLRFPRSRHPTWCRCTGSIGLSRISKSSPSSNALRLL